MCQAANAYLFVLLQCMCNKNQGWQQNGIGLGDTEICRALWPAALIVKHEIIPSALSTNYRPTSIKEAGQFGNPLNELLVGRDGFMRNKVSNTKQ